MAPERKGYINVDRLIEQVSPQQVATYYRSPWPAQQSGPEVRIDCLFNECTDDSYGKLVVNVARPENPIFCHQCGVRGNLLTLMWGMKHGRPPTGGKLKGDEFKEVRDDLIGIAGGADPVSTSSRPADMQPAVDIERPAPRSRESSTEPPKPNVPLKDSPNERARELVSLHEHGTLDVGEMRPDAARYFRQRPWLTPEVCEKWNVTYLPPNAKGTLRGRVIYPMRNEAGDVLAWVGRDPEYDRKLAAWQTGGRPDGKEPMKHRFPNKEMFRRGLELFGQQANRLKELGYREAIAELGIVIVEGFNDVIRLDGFQTPAVAVCSNRITDEQAEKVTAWARQLADGKVTVFFDNDKRGTDGAKETIWKLSQHGPVLQAWPPESGDAFDSRQPESLSFEEWNAVRQSLVERWRGR